MSRVKYGSDHKFDLQLEQALIDERRLGEIFETKRIEKVELKGETVQWEETGNIAIEFRQNGRPSGISTTEADYWVHELKRPATEPDQTFTLVYLMFPMERIKELARTAIREGRVCHRSGDGKRSAVALVRLRDILA